MVGVAGHAPGPRPDRHGEDPARLGRAPGQATGHTGHAVLGLGLRLGANDFFGDRRGREHFDLERPPLGRRKGAVVHAREQSFVQDRRRGPRWCEDRTRRDGMEAGVDDLGRRRPARAPCPAAVAAQPPPRQTTKGRRGTDLLTAGRDGARAWCPGWPALAGGRAHQVLPGTASRRQDHQRHGEQRQPTEPSAVKLARRPLPRSMSLQGAVSLCCWARRWAGRGQPAPCLRSPCPSQDRPCRAAILGISGTVCAERAVPAA